MQNGIFEHNSGHKQTKLLTRSPYSVFGKLFRRNTPTLTLKLMSNGPLMDTTNTCFKKTRVTFFFETLQYSSQIVETDTVSLEFSRKFLRFTPHTFALTVMYPLPPQC